MTIFAILGVLAFLLILVAGFRDLGYRSGVNDGFQAGYERGRKDLEDWWNAAEKEVDEEREKIWREEAKRRGAL